jgi:hypothetical protein
MADIVDVFTAEHREILERLKFLVTTPRQSPHEHLRVNELTQELVILCSGHEAVEELRFWPAVRQRVPGGEGLAETAIEQETEAKWALHHLNGRVPEDPEFDSLLIRFADAARHHVEFEENEVWPAFVDAVGPADREELGAKAASDMRTAPTRPHPGTPATPRALGTVGRLTAFGDRALDVLTGRGRPFQPGPAGSATAQDERESDKG